MSKKFSFGSFVVQRVTFWIKNFKCVRVGAVFSQLDKFRITIFKKSQFSKKKFYNASDFEIKMICKKNRFWWKFCFQKFLFGSFYSKKRQFLQLCVFSKTNNCLRKWKKNSFLIMTFEKSLILKQVFNKASDSPYQNFQIRSIFSQFYTTRQFLYRKFYNVSDFETSFYHTSDLERKF